MNPTETVPAVPATFADLGLPADLCATIQELGYENPTPVQARSIPIVLSGKDMIGQAQTGTGKTAAFALPLLSKIVFGGRPETQVLVLAPTRELAIQVAEAFKSYARGQKNFNVCPIYGGQPIHTQLRQLERRPQVVVGTPGRVMDHLRRGSLSIAAISALVIDEADEMLSMGFLEDIKWIMEQSPVEKQTILFSATMSRVIRGIAQKYLIDPQEVVIEQVMSTSQLITQSHWVVSGLHKLDALTRILEISEIDGVLIFMRTKTATLELAEKLEARGYRSGALNGDMSQEARDRTVQSFKSGRLDILVATDVAARGLDIDRVSHVINYDVPFDLQTYTHRIGRTGRAGRAGSAILFVSPREQGLLRVMERGTGKKIPPFKMPTKEELADRRIDRFVGKIEAALKDTDFKRYSKVIDTVVERTQAQVGTVAAALCALLSQDTPIFVDDREIVEDQPQQRREGGAGGGKRHWQKGGGQGGSDRRERPAYRGGGDRRDRPAYGADQGAERGRFNKGPNKGYGKDRPAADRAPSGDRPSGDRAVGERAVTERAHGPRPDAGRDRPAGAPNGKPAWKKKHGGPKGKKSFR